MLNWLHVDEFVLLITIIQHKMFDPEKSIYKLSCQPFHFGLTKSTILPLLYNETHASSALTIALPLRTKR